MFPTSSRQLVHRQQDAQRRRQDVKPSQEANDEIWRLRGEFWSSSNSILRVTFSCQALIKTVQDIQEFSSPKSKNQWRKTRKSLQKKEPIEEEEEELSE